MLSSVYPFHCFSYLDSLRITLEPATQPVCLSDKAGKNTGENAVLIIVSKASKLMMFLQAKCLLRCLGCFSCPNCD